MREGLAFGGLLVTVAAIAYDLGARSCAQAGPLDLVAGPLDLVAGLLVLIVGLLVLIAGLLVAIIRRALHQATMQGPLP